MRFKQKAGMNMHPKKKATRYILFLFILIAFICGTPLPAHKQMTNSPISKESLFRAHFIDVGQADCTLLENDGSYFMIDTGEAEDREMVNAYLKKCEVNEFAGMILSHPHSDHIGLAAYLMEQYNFTGAIYMTEETYESKDYRKIRQLAEKNKIEIIIPVPGGTADFGNSKIEFMGPIQKENDLNNMSIMAKVTYGRNSFFFTGDGGREEERDIIEAGYSIDADVLKVGHHGSETSSSYLFLREMNPKYAVISCGENNSYGHPHKETLSRFRDADTEVYRTDTMGSIAAVSDGITVTLQTEGKETKKFPADLEEDSAKAEYKYIANINSKVLHKNSCEKLPIEKNRIYFENTAEAVLKGYHFCQRCKP